MSEHLLSSRAFIFAEHCTTQSLITLHMSGITSGTVWMLVCVCVCVCVCVYVCVCVCLQGYPCSITCIIRDQGVIGEHIMFL